MTAQLSFDDLPQRRFPDVAEHIEAQFLAFHAANPGVYELFKFFAHEARARFKRLGVGAVCERLRWESSINPSDHFKINNSYRSCMARMLIQEEPLFADFFETRKSPKLEVH